MFMAHLPVDEFDELEDEVKLFSTDYLIAHECADYSHYHFMVKITDTEYHNFSKRIFRDRYALCGRATKGNPRQYGKIKKVKDEELAMAYTLKDGNYRTNMDEEYIQTIIDKSFKKKDKDTDKQKLFKYLDGFNFREKHKDHADMFSSNRSIQLQILEAIYRYINIEDTNLSLSRTAINNYFLNYLRTTQQYSIEKKIFLQMSFNGHN